MTRIGFSCQRIRKSETLFTHTKSVPTKTPSARLERAQSVFIRDGALARSTPTPGGDDRSRRDECARKIPTHRLYDDRIDRHRRDRSRPVAHSTSSWKRISTPPDRSGPVRHRVSSVRAPRASDARVECEKIFYEIRTWTLVALKAATRPTKEEARRADISIV